MAGGEDEGEQGVVADLFDQRNGLFEFCFRLSGEANDHSRGKNQLRHDRLCVAHLFQISFPILVPVHRL